MKLPGHEADHSLPSSAEVKNGWSYTYISLHAITIWCLIRRRGEFVLRQIVAHSAEFVLRQIVAHSAEELNSCNYTGF